MKIIAVDDEQLALQNLVTMLKRVEAAAEIVSFSDSQEALSYLAENQADIVFLDIEMGELNGIALAVKCKELCSTINIIFVTGYSQYMQTAFQLHVSGYLMKPVREKDLREELDNLRFPLPHIPEHRVRIQTFV